MTLIFRIQTGRQRLGKSSLGRLVRDRKEAAALLGEWKGSGERMSDWCAVRGINWYSLNAHGGRGCVQPTPQFVELTVAEPVVQVPAAGRYRLHVGDITLEVDHHFQDDAVRRLLQVVAAC